MTGNMIGKIFNNRYKITDRIGIGGMAEVYRAHDNVLGRTVAVKTMLPQYAADSSFTQRFRQEAASAANLQSPYIVNVYDWGQDDGTYYIVMEYVRGSDLKTAINERGAINQRKVAEIGTQVCQALSAAHKLDIIHRDIKPQNIMVQPDGNVKVMDFGIARAKNSVMTQTSSVLGTAHYISPEQAQGKELTPTSDIYSLGVVLYEAATGRLPFDGPDAVSVAMKQVNEYPPLPSEINPDIDPDFEDILMKALEKRPQDRFATANDMRLALNDYLAGRPVALGGSFTGAETAVVGGLAGAAAAGGLGDKTAVMPAANKPVQQNGGQTAYRSADDNKQGKSKKKTALIVAGIIVALLVVGGIAYGIMNMGADSGTQVPDVTNLTVEAASQRLEEAGFELGRQDSAYNDTVEAGRIISQDPPANSRAAEGSRINVIVSSGREEVTVPDLSGKTADEARQLLNSLGLLSTSGTAEYSSTVEANRIIRQNPVAGATAYKGDTVTYILSLGTESSSVPDVVGKGFNEATRILEDAGFHVSRASDVYSDTVPEGAVVRQDPSGGFRGALGQTVTLTVSKGPEPQPEPDPTVPNVVGRTVTDATATLQAAGYNVTVSPSGSSSPDAIVKSQSPTAQSTAARGSLVTIVAESAPTPPEQPSAG